MTWQHALEILASHSHVQRYRELCEDETRDDFELFRQHVIRLASEETSYPDLSVQARTAIKAFGRWAMSGFKITPWQERLRRKSICAPCEFFDPKQKRCTVCGCGAAKPWIATEVCPKGKWEVTGPG